LLNEPLTLAGPNTWTIGASINMFKPVSGASQPVAMSISNGVFANLGPSFEVGPITITGVGGGPTSTGLPPSLSLYDLNGADGQPVTLHGVTVGTARGTIPIGPLTSNGA